MKEKIKNYIKENKKLFIGIFIGIFIGTSLVLFFLSVFIIFERDSDLTSCQARCYDKYYPNFFSFPRCLNECDQKYLPQRTLPQGGALPWEVGKEVIEPSK